MQTRLRELAARRPYHCEGYAFVMRALEFSLRSLASPRHLNGQELLDGLRRLALQEFGPMARYVLEQWGIQSSRDVGEIVFDLVEAELLAKTDEDSIEDFAQGFDFEKVFEQDYYQDFAGSA